MCSYSPLPVFGLFSFNDQRKNVLIVCINMQQDCQAFMICGAKKSLYSADTAEKT